MSEPTDPEALRRAAEEVRALRKSREKPEPTSAAKEKYSPAQALKEEVDRFHATNTFTPFLVTNFYVQARAVLEQLAEANQALAERDEDVTRRLDNEHTLADCPSKGICPQCRLRQENAELRRTFGSHPIFDELKRQIEHLTRDKERLDWLLRQAHIEYHSSGTYSGRMIFTTREAIDAAKKEERK